MNMGHTTGPIPPSLLVKKNGNWDQNILRRKGVKQTIVRMKSARR